MVQLPPSILPLVETSHDVRVAEPILVELPMPPVIRQGYLEIQEVATREGVTVIEVLSPVNKHAGEGRRTYEAKRQTIWASATSLVEIDLLRRWSFVVLLPENLQTHYRILVSPSVCRPQALLYGFNLPRSVAVLQP